MEVNGLRLAFLAYANVPVEARLNYYDVQTWDATEDTPGMAWGTVERVVEDVSAVAPLVDHVIVVVHAGYEYVKGPSNEQYNISHAAIDAGATLYIGHHAHILQAIEQYNEGLIVYGLGNFAFNIDGPPETAIIHITLGKEGVLDWRLFPAMVTETGAPRMATPAETERILADIPFYRTRSWVFRE
jgi:poly-gamma-glutamate synthesis protein (capsule biosynthesis protein)